MINPEGKRFFASSAALVQAAMVHLNVSQTALAALLSERLGRVVPYSRAYISKMAHGHLPVPARIERVLRSLVPLHAAPGMQVTLLFSTHQLPACTRYMGTPRQCPACGQHFIPQGRERYCGPDCRRAGRTAARRKKS